MHFWSKIDAVGQDSAVVFPTEGIAQKFLNDYPTKFSTSDSIAIQPIATSNGHYASIAECVAVGVPDWSEQLKRGDLIGN